MLYLLETWTLLKQYSVRNLFKAVIYYKQRAFFWIWMLNTNLLFDYTFYFYSLRIALRYVKFCIFFPEIQTLTTIETLSNSHGNILRNVFLQPVFRLSGGCSFDGAPYWACLWRVNIVICRKNYYSNLVLNLGVYVKSLFIV